MQRSILVSKKLHVFTELLTAVSLAAACREHAQPNTPDQFWSNSYHVNEIMLNVSDWLLPSSRRHSAKPADVNEILAGVIFYAAMITLHEQVANEADRDKVSATIIVKSQGKCTAAAVNIAFLTH